MTGQARFFQRATGEGVADYPAHGLRFDAVIALLTAVFGAGLYLDGWAHNTFPDLIETFFTPYHAVLYGGFVAVTAVLLGTAVMNARAGYPWQRALPRAYSLALPGVALFALGGVGDMLWHEAFGFEKDIEALLSPTHLLLVVGGLLLGSGPLRAAWGRPPAGEAPGWRRLFPAILSLMLFISTFTFFTQFTHMARTWTLTERPVTGFQSYSYSVIAIYGQMVPLLLLTGAVLFFMRRWRLPAGMITFLVFGNYLIMFLMTQVDSFATPWTLGAALLGGLLGDGLYRALAPAPDGSGGWRWFAFLMPFAISALHISSLMLSASVWWAIHMWAGAPVLIGLFGVLLSFLAAPPREAEE